MNERIEVTQDESDGAITFRLVDDTIPMQGKFTAAPGTIVDADSGSAAAACTFAPLVSDYFDKDGKINDFMRTGLEEAHNLIEVAMQMWKARKAGLPQRCCHWTCGWVWIDPCHREWQCDCQSYCCNGADDAQADAAKFAANTPACIWA